MSDLEAAPEAALPAGPPSPAEPPVPDLAGARSVEAASQKPEEASFSAPLNLAVEDVNDSSVTLTWDAPENVGPSGLDGYVVEYCKDGATEWVTANNKPFLSIRYIIRSLISGEKLHIRVKAVKGNAISQPAFLDQPVLIREILEEPKIRLPRYLRELYLRTVGDVINLLIPFRGKPKPQVTWTKEGQPLDPKQVVVRNTEKDSVFFIRAAQRKDSGKYQISVKILDELEDVATFDLQVIERPGSPENLKVVDVWGFNVALEWSPPQDKGNADLKGYTVQKADMKTKQWFTVLEHYNHTNCTVSDLIIGNSYSFRVFSENACGLSEMPAVTNDVTHITKSGIVYEPEKFSSRDFCEPPKFTQPLIDRTTTQGYSAQLVCCVRGFPKPKVIWMKNQKEIQEDPRYLVHMNQGICCLEIRKPSPFDGGVYTCKAVNPLGEASVDCKLNIKVPK
ncbi:myosin-binding protein H [Python bivittatus]|uniref:Myosin-binding protein H n=1 Tax=Python bivittatus TaxID=176946 RepID=A0A9F5J0X2_PYTBI|nr:myosin-binding protein H [Python bivittatus]XP_025022696.1 myosin-binding protein H [Python bivittatus]